MPVTVDSQIRVLSEDEFHRISEKVIGVKFNAHNRLGRLMDEEIYKQAIRSMCEAGGIVPVQREVQIRVTHKEFKKPYFIDLLVARVHNSFDFLNREPEL